MAYQENFIENVKAALVHKGWSQRELARQSDLHWQTVHRILSGGMMPSIDVCERIAVALDLRPEKIFRKPA